MHQPLTVTHEEGVSRVNGEIIHLPSTGSGRRLRLVDIPLEPNSARRAIRLADLVA